MADERTLISLRLRPETLERIDARRNLSPADLRLSRNEWIIRALDWALAQPVRTTTKTEKL